MDGWVECLQVERARTEWRARACRRDTVEGRRRREELGSELLRQSRQRLVTKKMRSSKNEVGVRAVLECLFVQETPGPAIGGSSRSIQMEGREGLEGELTSRGTV